VYVGNLTKLTSEDEFAKAQEEVRDRLQKMKQLLSRVGAKAEETAGSDKEQVGPVKPVQRRTSAPVDSIAAAIAAKRNSASTKVGARQSSTRDTAKLGSSASSPTASVGGASEAERVPRIVHRARTVQSLIRRSRVDAGTDPLESLMSHNKPVVVLTPTRGCEMETQTTLPPAPVLSVSTSDSLRGDEARFPLASGEPQNNDERMGPEEQAEKAVGPQQNDNAIEAEMKDYLMQYAAGSSSSAAGNQDSSEAQPEEDVNPARFWSDSPRLETVKTAELRKPPTSLSRTGYRSFRMPSRPNSSDSF
jgi:hypothetical protein